MLIVRIMEADYIGCDADYIGYNMMEAVIMLIVRIMEADYDADC